MLKLEKIFTDKGHLFTRITRLGFNCIYSVEALQRNGDGYTDKFANPYQLEYQVIKIAVEKEQRINIDGFRIDV